ncbi:YhgE/Pip domain-containing protein [Weissella cibaria]|uniref:YhgE/Pip domain-containing protein n=1 Tax=Weissella cibaria TaxID=137591 RepID=UPI00118F6CA4|nr:YhgE/Pip domain-containing protein [Weissella cibaria]MCS8562515.1 YhgE/Pip domain-containing protein [Weissella cibaria]MCS8565887.1 YhgE/Pip domain-containing protein [Weissella cibaria]MCS8577279.1 YhgE/Pip domain-containing protein [Weissella cibaria]MCS9999566.1 YhgE/Pip domain-containing protein [Weissella cibaria]MDK9678891.1 YhgE/Pip domain-containing protein [Weissella cibaria]
MLKAEWAWLKQHKFYLLVIFVLFFVPSIYAVTFLSSLWDPYGAVKNLPVAVVNHDKSVKYQGKKLTVGSDLKKQLEKSKAMDFSFPTDAAAKKGLKDGKYYTVITIPENFSKNATTLLDKQPKKMVLHYETSSGHSFIAGKLSESGAKAITAKVSAQVTETYAKTIFGQVKKMGKGITQAADANQKLADGTTKIKSGSDEVTTNLEKLASSSLTFKDGTNTLTNGLSQYTAGVAQADSGSQQLAAGLNKLNGQVPTLTQGVAKLNDGTHQYTAGVNQLAGGLNRANDGARQYTGGVSQVTNGLNTINGQAPTLTQGITQINDGTHQYTAGVEKITGGLNQANEQTPTLTQGIAQINDGTYQYTAGVKQLTQGLDELNTQLQQSDMTNKIANAQQTLGDIQQAVAKLQNSYQGRSGQDVLAGIQQHVNVLQDDVTKIQAAQKADSDAMTANLQQAFTDTKMNPEQQAAVAKAVQATQDNSQVATLMKDMMGEYTALSSEVAPIQQMIDDNKQLVDSVEVNDSTLTDAQNQLNQLATLPGAVQQLDAGANQIDSQSQALTDGTSELQAKSGELVNGIAQLTDGANTLNSKSASLNDGTSELLSKSGAMVNGIGQLANGANAVNNKSGELVSGIGQLVDGANTLDSKSAELNNGTEQLLAGSDELAGGAGQLANGANTLTSGLDTLAGKNNELNSGAGQLASGAGQISDGSQKLADGSKQIGPALTQVQNGNQTLANKMGDASDKVKKLHATKSTYHQVATPVKASHKEKDHVANNGTGMVPYMFSVAMFVGMMALNLMLDMISPRTKISSLWAWAGSKMAMLFGIAIVAATVLYGLSLAVLGMDPINPGATYGFMVLIAVMDAALVTAIYMWFGKAGAFAAMVLLVIQLSGSAGTYPIQLSNKFFEWLHPYLPMTYTVDGLRETVMIGGSIAPQVEVLVGIFVVSIAAMMIYYLSHRRHYNMLADATAK